MSKAPITNFINSIGQETLLSELDVTERALRHAKNVGYFAAGWYLPVKEVSERHGVHCPIDLFNWKSLDKKRGAAPRKRQGASE